MAKKELPKTVIAYRKWNAAKWGLYAGMFAAPVIPASIMTAINWNEWFAQSGVSLPLGFASLLVSTVLSIIGIWKKDDITNKAVSAVYYLALIFVCFGATFLFLANIFSQVGYMFLLTAGGLAVGGTSDQVNKSLVKPRVEEYKKLIEENALDERAKKKAERKAQAKLDAEKELKERQATE